MLDASHFLYQKQFTSLIALYFWWFSRWMSLTDWRHSFRFSVTEFPNKNAFFFVQQNKVEHSNTSMLTFDESWLFWFSSISAGSRGVSSHGLFKTYKWRGSIEDKIEIVIENTFCEFLFHTLCASASCL